MKRIATAAVALLLLAGVLHAWWNWENVVDVRAAVDPVMAETNSPALALNADYILTGYWEENVLKVLAPEAANGENPDFGENEVEIFRHENTDEVIEEGPAMGYSSTHRQAAWALFDDDDERPRLIHSRGELEAGIRNWTLDTAHVRTGAVGSDIRNVSMATALSRVFLVYLYESTDVSSNLHYNVGFARNAVDGAKGSWSLLNYVGEEFTAYEMSYPSVACWRTSLDAYKLVVCWIQETQAEACVMYARSNNAGAAWLDPEVLSNIEVDLEASPSIYAIDECVCVAFTDADDATWLRFSEDGGVNWSDDVAVGTWLGKIWGRYPVFGLTGDRPWTRGTRLKEPESRPGGRSYKANGCAVVSADQEGDARQLDSIQDAGNRKQGVETKTPPCGSVWAAVQVPVSEQAPTSPW